MYGGNQQRSNQINQALAHEARLNRLHRLFKTHFNVTEPSMIMEPYLFLGNCISAHDVNRLARLGVRYVLNVAIRDVEVCPYYPQEMRTLTIDLRDDDRENILRIFDQAFAFIDEARRAKSRVLVHCSHGQSRSPAIVIAYLMRCYHVSLEQCLAHVIKARPCVIPNDGFLKQLILYDRFLVERRRQQQRKEEDEALRQVVQAMPPSTTEIPIQHHPNPPANPPVQINIAPVSTPPHNSHASENGSSRISSVDSSSLATSSASASSVQSSSSNHSIHVIPIQATSPENKPLASSQVATPENSRVSPSKEPSKSPEIVLEQKMSNKHSPITFNKPSIEISSSQHALSSMQAANHSLHDFIDHPSIIEVTSAGSAEQLLSDIHHHHDVTSNYVVSEQQWDFLNQYPDHLMATNGYKPTRYITEVYDRATNRFIPTTCCY